MAATDPSAQELSLLPRMFEGRRRQFFVGTAYALTALEAFVAGYYAIFSSFAGYDDEGTILATVSAFSHGDVLYRDIYSSYGPFYYELFGGLFAVTGHPVSTHVSRLIVLVVWVGTSFGFGLVCHKLSRSASLGIAGMIVAFASLTALINEPMHPHGLCVLLASILLLVVILSLPRPRAGFGLIAGLLLAAILLSKVNLGIFAVAATVFAAVLSLQSLHRRRWIRLPVVVAFVVMPLILFFRDLEEPWVRDLALMELMATAALLLTINAREPAREGSSMLARWLFEAAVGVGVGVVAILGVIIATGSSPADIYGGVVDNALAVRDILIVPLPESPAAITWAVLSLGAAALTAYWGAPWESANRSLWTGILRAAAGLTIWLTIARIPPFASDTSVGNPDTLPLALAWVAAIPPPGVRESAFRSFVRILIPALAVAETIQVYPVAGSQIGIASVFFVPVGAACITDGLASLRDWSCGREPLTSRRFALVSRVALAALVGVLSLNAILRYGGDKADTYSKQQSLPFAGATALRLPQPDVDIYAGLVSLLHEKNCSAFVGYPSLNSLYLWSGIAPPATQIPNAWMEALNGSDQQELVDEMRASRRPCAIRNDSLASDLYLQGEPPPQRPLVRYIFNDFKTIANVGSFQFMVPKGKR